MSLAEILSFSGRVNRQPYIFMLIVLGGLGGISSVMLKEGLAAVISIVLLWPTLAMQVKRWHDLGKSGWFVLLNIIPIVNFIVAIYLVFKSGDQGSNQYGSNPLLR